MKKKYQAAERCVCGWAEREDVSVLRGFGRDENDIQAGIYNCELPGITSPRWIRQELKIEAGML